MYLRVQFAAAFSALLFLLIIWNPAQAASARERDFQDWRLRCERKDDNDPERCFIVQIAKSTKAKREVLRIGVRYPEPEKPAIVFLTLPLGIYLPAGLFMQIDDGETLKIPARSSCVVLFRLRGFGPGKNVHFIARAGGKFIAIFEA